ncbi:MAG: photosystem I reaction center subunit IX [Prochlorococcaceae cyanobacterium ETNP1_MAG_9]|nr:photosystem I reaction center subunit IX [Prochlorococcaceae cyanobacterium ETNP1_MAG_9]
MSFKAKHKIFRSVPVIGAGWIIVTAGYLIEFNRFHPDLLFHPMSAGM